MYVRMKKFPMFQQNYMTVLKMADNFGISVLLVLRVFFRAPYHKSRKKNPQKLTQLSS